MLAAITGVVVGLLVRGSEYVIGLVYERVVDAEPWQAALAPVAGLVGAAVILRVAGGGASPATSDEYLRAFHDPAYRLRPRALVARIGVSIVTIGSGAALGPEGPWIYGGSAVGALIQRRLPEPFRAATTAHCWSPAQRPACRPC